MRIHLLTICVFHHNRLFDHLGSMCKVQKLIWWADVCCVFWVNNSWKIHQSSIIQFISRHSFPASSFSHTTYQSRLDTLLWTQLDSFCHARKKHQLLPLPLHSKAHDAYIHFAFYFTQCDNHKRGWSFMGGFWVYISWALSRVGRVTERRSIVNFSLGIFARRH